MELSKKLFVAVVATTLIVDASAMNNVRKGKRKRNELELLLNLPAGSRPNKRQATQQEVERLAQEEAARRVAEQHRVEAARLEAERQAEAQKQEEARLARVEKELQEERQRNEEAYNKFVAGHQAAAQKWQQVVVDEEARLAKEARKAKAEKEWQEERQRIKAVNDKFMASQLAAAQQYQQQLDDAARLKKEQPGRVKASLTWIKNNPVAVVRYAVSGVISWTTVQTLLNIVDFVEPTTAVVMTIINLALWIPELKSILYKKQ